MIKKFKNSNAVAFIVQTIIIFLLISILVIIYFILRKDNKIYKNNSNEYSSINLIKENNLIKQTDAEMVHPPENEYQYMIQTLSNLADSYDQSNSILLCLQFIRRNKYNNNSWNTVAGNIDSNFINYIQKNNIDLYNYDFDSISILDKKSNFPVDFVHMCATLNSYIYLGDISFSRFSGWAGDLTTLMEQVISYNNNNKTKDELLEYTTDLLATTNTSKHSNFGISDMLADIDAVNLYNIFTSKSTTFYNLICNYYYTDNYNISNREYYFKLSLEKSDKTIENAVINTFTGIINSRLIKQLLSEKNYLEYTKNYNLYNNIMATAFNNYFSKYQLE